MLLAQRGSQRWRKTHDVAKRRAGPGDVCAFDLGDGRFAYGRVLRDASIAIYRTVAERPDAPPIGEQSFLFTVGIYDDLPGSTACPVVGHDPFKSEDEAWPPPTKVVDPITGKVRMYHRGEIVEAPDAAEAERLEKAAVWDSATSRRGSAPRCRVDRKPAASLDPGRRTGCSALLLARSGRDVVPASGDTTSPLRGRLRSLLDQL